MGDNFHWDKEYWGDYYTESMLKITDKETNEIIQQWELDEIFVSSKWVFWPTPPKEEIDKYLKKGTDLR